MQAVGMIVYVVVRWHVKLHRNLVALEEEIGDKLHFWPVRATVRATDADVIPSLAAGGHDSDRLAIHGRRDHEHSRATVARPAPILHDMAVGSAILIKLVEVSQHLAPLGVNRISIVICYRDALRRHASCGAMTATHDDPLAVAIVVEAQAIVMSRPPGGRSRTTLAQPT